MTRARLFAPLAAVALLAGCSLPTPSVAVQVGTAKITETQVTNVAEGCGIVLAQPAANLRRDVVVFLTRGELATQIAAANNIDLGRGVLDTFVRTQAPGIVSYYEDDDCAQLADAAAKFEIVAGTVADPAAVLALTDQIELQLNPRYGTWDPATLEASGTGSLSEPFEA